MIESKPAMYNHLYSTTRDYSDDLIKRLVKGHYNRETFHIIEVVDGINISFFCNGMETRVYDEKREIQLNHESINFWGNRHQIFQKIIEIQKQLQIPIQLFFTYYGDNLNQNTKIQYTQDKTRNFILKDIKNLSKNHYLNRSDLETVCVTHGLTPEIAHRKVNLLALKDIKNLSTTSLLAAKNGVYDQQVYKYIVKPVTTIIFEERRLIISLNKQQYFTCERKIEEDLIKSKLTFDNVFSIIGNKSTKTFTDHIITIAQEVYTSILSDNKLVSYKLTKKITAKKLKEYMDELPF
jgi:hypothetical protein